MSLTGVLCRVAMFLLSGSHLRLFRGHPNRWQGRRDSKALRQEDRLSHGDAGHGLNNRGRGRLVLLMLLDHLLYLLLISADLGAAFYAQLRDGGTVADREYEGGLRSGFVLLV